MADIFKEIDEEMKADRAADLWKKYGNYLIACGVVIILGVGGYRYWDYQDLSGRASDSTAYEAALAQIEDEKTEDALTALGALSEDAGVGYAVLARLQQAALALEGGDSEGALLAYEAVAGDSGAPTVLRDLARLRIAAVQIEDGQLDGVDAQLDALIEEGNPWRPMALELQGVLALQGGDTEAARTIFSELSDDEASPASLRARATEILKTLPAS